jgi:flagellar hook-length control protein FliK
MDSIASILPQIASASGATGNAAPDAAESGLFASLLAAQTTPVSPVPAVTPRPQGDTRFAPQSPASETGSVLADLTISSPTPSPAASSTTGHPAEIASPAANMLPSGDGVLAAQVSAEPAGLQATANAGGVTAAPTHAQTAETPSTPIAPTSDQPAADIPTTNTKASAVDANAATGSEAEKSPKPVTAEGIEVAKQPARITGKSVSSAPRAEPSPLQAAPAVPANMATASMPTVAETAPQAGQAAIQTAVPAAPQAGVQARRDAAPGQRASGVLTASGGKTSGVSPAASSNSLPSDMKSASSPPPPPPPAVTPPQIQPQQGDVQPDAARLTAMGDKPPLPPIADLPSSETDADGDRVDLSTLRAADASRTAERPGTAAGTARFTPATAGSLAAQIAAKFQNGDRKFAIRMDPPELGKIEVKLHVGNDNRVHAILSAERPETLNDMRQYARDLERALEEAGLQLENDGLSFELSQGDENPDENRPGPGGFSNLEFAEDLSGPITAAAAPAELYGFRLTAQSGVNIRL